MRIKHVFSLISLGGTREVTFIAQCHHELLAHGSLVVPGHMSSASIDLSKLSVTN